VTGGRACAEDLPSARTEATALAAGSYFVAGVFVSDLLPEDDDEESEELFEDSFFSDEDELSEEDPSEEDSLLLETPSLDSFISRARFFVP
jgi:hypothetical protein